MIRVALSDGSLEMRVALRLLLSLSNDIKLIYETSNGQEAVECVRRLPLDVLPMDIHMPILDGFEATKQINDLSVSTRVILISSDLGSFVARKAASVGAKGFVPKDNVAKLLLLAIETVHQGKTRYDPSCEYTYR